MAASYKRIAQILEKWPVDKTKTGRDFGEYLSKHYQKLITEGKSDNNLEESDKNYLSLKRLIEDEHKKKFTRKIFSSSSGLTAEQCKEALSKDFLEILQEEEQPLYKKVLGKFTSK